MIIGAHSIVYSKDSDADRAFLRDVLGFPFVDAGGGWLIFGLPPAEVAVHPSERDEHELYLMTDDVEGLIASMGARGVETTPISRESWGLLTRLTLPGGGKLGVYQPLHASPAAHAAAAGAVSRRSAPTNRKRASTKQRVSPKKPSTKQRASTPRRGAARSAAKGTGRGGRGRRGR
jgi:hypothetical protein